MAFIIRRSSRILQGVLSRSTKPSRNTASQLGLVSSSTAKASYPPAASRRTFALATGPDSSSSAQTMPLPSKMAALQSHLTPNLFQEVRDFWFEHLDNENHLVLPAQEHAKRWFFGGKEFDNICVERFSPVLVAIRESGLTTGDEILRAANPSNPLDWMSLIIILDQLPRNCYRGGTAAVVFNFFDPIARQITMAAIEKGVDMDPEIRWRLAYRPWLFLPLMHSEDLAAHETAVEEYAQIVKDVEDLIVSEDDPANPDKYCDEARKIVKENAEAAKAFAQTYLDFEKKHQVIIQQFGRYPHRNKALGREPTEAETKYLRDGGETFG